MKRTTLNAVEGSNTVKKSKPPQRIAGYLRISDEDKLQRLADENTSIENQRQIVKMYCDENFPNAELTFFEDRAISGYSFDKRPGYLAMRQGLFDGKYDTLIIKDLSRFSRRNGHGLAELEDLRDANVRIISISDNVDTVDDDDWLKVRMFFFVNEMPVADASKKVTAVIRAKQKSGEWICNAPYGYTKDGRTQNYKIVQETVPVIKLIFEKYLEGWGYGKIRDYLNENKVPTPRMTEKIVAERKEKTYKRNVSNGWSAVSIQKILTNDAYIGTYRGHKVARKGINGKMEDVPEDEHIVIEHHHEAIIDDATFQSVQLMMKQRTRNNYRGVRKYPTPYTGILFCGDCGARMFSISRPDLRAAYKCSNYQKAGIKSCTGHKVVVEDLDRAAKSYLMLIRSQCKDLEAELKKSIENEKEVTGRQAGSIEELEKLLARKENALEMSIQSRIEDIAENPENAAQIKKTYKSVEENLNREIESIKSNIEILNNERNSTIKANRTAKTVFEVFDNIIKKPALDENDVRFIFERINVFEDGHIDFYLRSDIDELLRIGGIPEPVKEKPINFRQDTVDIALEGRIVQPSGNGLYDVYSVNVVRSGDALEIFTAADGQVVFKKYSPLVELGELAGVYAEVLAKNLGRPVLVCDRESIVAATGTGKGQLLGRQISDAAARLLAMRGPYTAPETAARRITAFDKGETVLLCVCPIVVQGDVEGGVLLTGRPQDAAPDTETARAVNIAAAFLAKWMEE